MTEPTPPPHKRRNPPRALRQAEPPPDDRGAPETPGAAPTGSKRVGPLGDGAGAPQASAAARVPPAGRTPARRRLAALLDRARSLLAQRTLAAILAICACGVVFARLADETRAGATASFDRAVLLALRSPTDPGDPLGPGWIEEFGRDVTALGSLGVLLGITAAVAGYLWLLGKRETVVLVLVSVLGGQAASTLFKLGFDRPRPDLVPHGALTYSSSFPSGHAMMAAVTYLTLAALLARAQPTRARATYLLAIAVVLTLSIGISRIYLGVHWPTDVLAGWAAGAGWALLCLAVATRLRRRGVIAPGPAEEP